MKNSIQKTILLILSTGFLLCGCDSIAAEQKQQMMTPSLSHKDTTTIFGVTVKESYLSIPHQQTPFNLKEAQMERGEAKVLDYLFHVVDFAIVGKVQTMEGFQSHGERGISFEQYESQIDIALSELERVSISNQLSLPYKLIIEAIGEQKSYLAAWHESTVEGQSFKFNSHHPLIRSSHQKLINAYTHLMKSFPDEKSHNRQAFFDHLCALDFI